MEEEKFYTIILRHDESTKWMINDPILALGEYGVFKGVNNGVY